MTVRIRHTEKIGAVLFLILSAVVFYLSGQFPESPTETGPGSYPRVIVTLMAVFALVQLGRSLYTGETTTHEVRLPTAKRVVSVVVLISLYVIIMPYIGFLLGTGLFLAITIRYSGGDNWVHIAVVSVIIPIVLYYAFGLFLRVPMPVNPIVPIIRYLPPLPLTIGVIG